MHQLKSNKELYQRRIGEDINVHIDKISKDGGWGEMIDIEAISDFLNWEIVIHMKGIDDNFTALEQCPRSKNL